MKQLILDYTPYCTRAALVEDGAMIEFSVEQANVRGLVGNIYKGKVENVLEGMKAAFVNIGLERNGFLYVGESRVDKTRLQSVMPLNDRPVSPGDVIMCQVIKDQFGQKGARLTRDITIAGYYLVLLPNSDFIGVSRRIENDKRREYLEQFVKSICPPNTGFIIRSAAAKASDLDILNDADNLMGIWAKVQSDFIRAPEKSMVFEEASLFERAIRDTFCEDVDKVIVNDDSVAERLKGNIGKAKIEKYVGERNIMSHYGLSSQINHLCDHKVPVAGGAYIVIDKTEALTVIDVNTGKFVGSTDLEDTVFRTNMMAAEEIARQLRLRNISGIVIIDFIDMQLEEHRTQVLETLKAALKHDRLKTSTVGMTSLGLVELTRKKTRLPLDDFMLQPSKYVEGGFVKSDAQLAFMLRDELVDYLLSHGYDTVYVGVCKGVYDVVFESNLMQRNITASWQGKQIYLYVSDSMRRDCFTMSDTAPYPYPAEIRCLTAASDDEQFHESDGQKV